MHTDTKLVQSVLIVPLLSWYHASFGSESEEADAAIKQDHPPVEEAMTDFAMCKWPDGLSAKDDSLAVLFNEMNRENMAKALQLKPQATVTISFSHFLPRNELCPEKRFLFYPPLPDAVGSLHLQRTVESLRPDLHVFGHTHYAWACQCDGIRCVFVCVDWLCIL